MNSYKNDKGDYLFLTITKTPATNIGLAKAGLTE
jgi:hypothetical protein